MKKLLFLLSIIFLSTYSASPLNLTIGTTTAILEDTKSYPCNSIGNGNIPLVAYSTDLKCIIFNTEESNSSDINAADFLEMISLWKENQLPAQYQNKTAEALRTFLLSTNNNNKNALIIRSFAATIFAGISNQCDFDEAWKCTLKLLGGD